MKKILMVCLGNICRSPLAEGILQHKITEYGLDWQVDSAGTGAWHAGEKPDRRSITTARARGIDITQQRARQLRSEDFDTFDHILVMDASNYQNVTRLADSDAQRDKVELIMNYAKPGMNQQVPDPYYGGDNGFEEVFDMLDEACEAFIKTVSA
jgi:protein-tyrosine phosphatase